MDGLNPQLLANIEKEFEKVDGQAAPVPTRTQVDVAPVATGGGGGGAAAAANPPHVQQDQKGAVVLTPCSALTPVTEEERLRAAVVEPWSSPGDADERRDLEGSTRADVDR